MQFGYGHFHCEDLDQHIKLKTFKNCYVHYTVLLCERGGKQVKIMRERGSSASLSAHRVKSTRMKLWR